MAWDVDTDEASQSRRSPRRAASSTPRSCPSEPERAVGALASFATPGSRAEVPVVMGVATSAASRMKARPR